MNTQNTFLPVGYELPAKNTWRYTKFENLQTKLRILSSCLVGWEYFNTDNKPIRQKQRFDKTPTDIQAGRYPKEFWAFVVYNYNTDQIEVCEITQRGLKEWILALIKDKDYWDPKTYDIKINKTGEKLNTNYSVVPGLWEPLKKEILDEYENNPIILEALFEWKNPFDYKFDDSKLEDLPL